MIKFPKNITNQMFLHETLNASEYLPSHAYGDKTLQKIRKRFDKSSLSEYKKRVPFSQTQTKMKPPPRAHTRLDDSITKLPKLSRSKLPFIDSNLTF